MTCIELWFTMNRAAVEVAFSTWAESMVAIHGEEQIAEWTVQLRNNEFVPDATMDILARRLVEIRPDIAADLLKARLESAD